MAFALDLPKIVLFRGVTVKNPLARLVLDLFSFEALFILFLFAGRYKGDPRFAFFPVDPTALFLVLSMAVGIVLILRERLYLPGAYAFGAWIVFLVYVWLSLTWTGGRGYSRDKAVSIAVFDTWCLIAGAMIMANGRERAMRFMKLVILFALWLAVEVLRGWAAQGFRGRVLINNGDSYLGYGRICGMGAIIAIAFWATRRGFDATRLLQLGLFGLFVLVLLIGGGRGPLISAFVPMLLIVLIGWKLGGSGLRLMKMQIPILLAMATVVGLVGYAISSSDVDLGQLATLARFRGIAEGNLVSGSDVTREDNVEQALAWIPRAPFIGQGIGSWPTVVRHIDIQDHPHNMVLEVMFELGLVGVVLLGTVFVMCLRNVTLVRLRTDPLMLAAAMLAINAFMNAMTSGDLGENRSVFVTMGLLLVRAVQEDDDAADEPADEPPVWQEQEDDLEAFRRLRPGIGRQP